MSRPRANTRIPLWAIRFPRKVDILAPITAIHDVINGAGYSTRNRLGMLRINRFI
jgi:hypothetical protein